MQQLYSSHTCQHIKLAGVPTSVHYRSWNQSIQQVLDELYSGKLLPSDLNVDLFTSYKDQLIKGASNGFKTDLLKIDYDTPDYALLSKMRRNLYSFAGAKTYQELREINNLLYDENGKLVSRSEFKRRAQYYYQQIGVIDQKYINWLDIEFNTVIAQATKARQWQEWMDNIHIFPNLKYVTAGDERVRPAHQALDGIVVAKNDPYVDKIIPVKDWGCRCDMVETDEQVSEFKPDVEFQGPFEGNVGKDGIAISNRHPYFPDAKKQMEAIQNRVDDFARNEHVSLNKAVYNQYKNDSQFERVSFNDQTGGFLVKHKDAGDYNYTEQTILNLLVSKGERVVLPAIETATYTKSYDLLLNDCKFEISDIAGNAKQQIEKRVREAMEQAANAILYFDKKVRMAEIKRGLGNLKSDARLNTVMIIVDDEIAVITKKEILAGDFEALESLK